MGKSKFGLARKGRQIQECHESGKTVAKAVVVSKRPNLLLYYLLHDKLVHNFGKVINHCRSTTYGEFQRKARDSNSKRRSVSQCHCVLISATEWLDFED